MIAGFEMPDGGTIAFGGQDVTRMPANQRGIGFVFQNYALFPHLSVAENVAYGLRVRGRAPADIGREVTEVLKLVGLAGYELQFPAQLSGGEQQRVALARAIVIRPRVLLFDEPLSNLDAKLRVQMRHEIRDLQQRLAITAIYVTHDQEEAMAVSDRIAVMNEGTIVQTGSAEDLYHRPASRFVAQFIGRANLVPAAVRSIDADGAIVDVLGRTLRVAAVPAGLAPGDRAALLVRPEAFVVGRQADDNRGWPARVVSRAFLGEKIEYGLDCAGERMQVVRYNAGPQDLFEEGETVVMRFVEQAVALIVDASAGAAS
jgi:iron(III) transport system ATP-binding protein